MDAGQALEMMRKECTMTQSLIDNTEPIRHILGQSFPCAALDGIFNLLEYYKKFENLRFAEGNLCLVLADMYQLGYIEGKRAERAKKKIRAQKSL